MKKMTFLTALCEGWASNSIKLIMAVVESNGKAQYRDIITTRTVLSNEAMYSTLEKYNGIKLGKKYIEYE